MTHPLALTAPLFAALTLSALAGCTTVAPSPADARLLVVIGSSTAEGTGPAHTDSTWVNRVRAGITARDPRVDVLNLARGGYTTFSVLPVGSTARPQDVDEQRNVTAALARHPAALVVNLPSNDAVQGVPVADQMANYEQIADVAEAAGVPVWVTTPLPREELGAAGRATLLALRDAILARFGDHAIDLWPLVTTPDGHLDPRFDSGDHVHLNDAAHGLIARAVFESSLDEYLLSP